MTHCMKTCSGSGDIVETRTSEHLFLDLPRLRERLEAWVQHSSQNGIEFLCLLFDFRHFVNF